MAKILENILGEYIGRNRMLRLLANGTIGQKSTQSARASRLRLELEVSNLIQSKESNSAPPRASVGILIPRDVSLP